MSRKTDHLRKGLDSHKFSSAEGRLLFGGLGQICGWIPAILAHCWGTASPKSEEQKSC